MAQAHCPPPEGRVLLEGFAQAHSPLPEGRVLPEGTVQALASKLEEGQVLLSHSPAVVVTAEGSGVRAGLGPQVQSGPKVCTHPKA